MPKKPAGRKAPLPQPPRPQARPVTPQMRTGTQPRPLTQQQRVGLRQAQATGDPSSYFAAHPGVLRHQGLVEMRNLQRSQGVPRPPVPGQAGGNMAQQMGVSQAPQPQMPLGGYQQPPPVSRSPYANGGAPNDPGLWGPQQMGGSGGWGYGGGPNLGMAGGNVGNPMGGGYYPGQFGGGGWGMAGGNMGAYFGQRGPSRSPYAGGGAPWDPGQMGPSGGMAGGNMGAWFGGQQPPTPQGSDAMNQTIPGQSKSGGADLMSQVNPGMQNVLTNRQRHLDAYQQNTGRPY